MSQVNLKSHFLRIIKMNVMSPIEIFFRRFLLVLVTFNFLYACAAIPQKSSNEVGANAEEVNPVFIDEFPEVDINQIVASNQLDLFKVGDIADVKFYNVDKLTATYVVDRAGNIVFPLIGNVRVVGLSTLDLQETLTQRYGEEYLQNPGISVKREGQLLGKVVVDGAVEKPGVFELSNVIRLSESIALAQGLTDEANRKEVYIIRTVDGERKVKTVNLDEVRKLGAADPQIIPNDIVFVQDSTAKIAFREFLRTLPLLNTIAIVSTR